MKRKHKFETPTVLQAVDLSLEGGLLAGSVVDNMAVRSMGQDVTEYDFSEGNTEGFNFEWGDG